LADTVRLIFDPDPRLKRAAEVLSALFLLLIKGIDQILQTVDKVNSFDGLPRRPSLLVAYNAKIASILPQLTQARIKLTV